MISIISEPERIINGDMTIVKLNIEGKVNYNTYKNMYFNLTIKKNGGNHGHIILYPLKFVGYPLEWEINPYSYDRNEGTYNVICTLQDSTIQICTCTFIIEPDSSVKKAYSSTNITSLFQNINIKKSIVKKQEEKIEYFQSFQVQKPEQIINAPKINHKENEIEKKTQINNELNKTNLLSTSKVQCAYKIC